MSQGLILQHWTSVYICNHYIPRPLIRLGYIFTAMRWYPCRGQDFLYTYCSKCVTFTTVIITFFPGTFPPFRLHTFMTKKLGGPRSLAYDLSCPLCNMLPVFQTCSYICFIIRNRIRQFSHYWRIIVLYCDQGIYYTYRHVCQQYSWYLKPNKHMKTYCSFSLCTLHAIVLHIIAM